MISRFISLPQLVEAYQWFSYMGETPWLRPGMNQGVFYCDTPTGHRQVSDGDWIVKLGPTLFDVCSTSEFREKYKPA